MSLSIFLVPENEAEAHSFLEVPLYTHVCVRRLGKTSEAVQYTQKQG